MLLHVPSCRAEKVSQRRGSCIWGSSKHHYATAHGVSLEALLSAAEHVAPSTTKCADRRGHHPEKRASLFVHDASTQDAGVGHGCLPPMPGLALTWQVVGPGGLRHTLSRYPPRIQRSRVHVRWRGIVSRGRGYGTNAAAGVRRPDPASVVLV